MLIMIVSTHFHIMKTWIKPTFFAKIAPSPIHAIQKHTPLTLKYTMSSTLSSLSYRKAVIMMPIDAAPIVKSSKQIKIKVCLREM